MRKAITVAVAAALVTMGAVAGSKASTVQLANDDGTIKRPLIQLANDDGTIKRPLKSFA